MRARTRIPARSKRQAILWNLAFFFFFKRGHFRLNGQGEDYSKAGTFCYIDYRLWEMNVWMCHAGGCVSAANAEVCR